MNRVELVARVCSVTFLGGGFISWILFTSGFGIYHANKHIHPEDEPWLYPFWAVSVCGPVIHGLALIHAVVSWNRIASIVGRIVGSVTILLFLIYITANGFVMIVVFSGYLSVAVILLRAGSVLSPVFWALHLACWPWFNFKYERNDENQSQSVCNTREMNKVEITTRSISIVFLALCFIAWIVVIAGMDVSGYGGYALFGVCALGLLVLGLALIHAVMFFNRIASIVGRIVGSVTSLLFMIYITAIGYLMIYSCFAIADDYESNDSYRESMNLFFAGSFLIMVFWALHLALWPWFNFKYERPGGSTSREYARL